MLKLRFNVFQILANYLQELICVACKTKNHVFLRAVVFILKKIKRIEGQSAPRLAPPIKGLLWETT